MLSIVFFLVLPLLCMESTVVSGLAVEDGRRGMETLWRLPEVSTLLCVKMSKFLEGILSSAAGCSSGKA